MLNQSISDPLRPRSLTQHAAIDIQQLLHQVHQSLFMLKFNYLANGTTAQLKPYSKTPETNSTRKQPASYPKPNRRYREQNHRQPPCRHAFPEPPIGPAVDSTRRESQQARILSRKPSLTSDLDYFANWGFPMRTTSSIPEHSNLCKRRSAGQYRQTAIKIYGHIVPSQEQARKSTKR